LAGVGRGDWILCQVTSNPYGDPLAIPLGEESFEEGSLEIDSFARPGKLFTASVKLMWPTLAFSSRVSPNRLSTLSLVF
jgi:mRNA interferase MazF